MGRKEWRPSNILDVFADPVARATLAVADERPVAVKELTETLDVSPPTVYRRIDPLVDANLLTERQHVDTDGNQHKEYETVLDEVRIVVDDGGYTVDVQIDRDLTDDFEAMWADIESTSHRLDVGQRRRSARDDEGRGDPA